MLRVFPAAAVGLLCVLPAACVDFDSSDSSPEPIELEATLPVIQEHLFDQVCVDCHNGGKASGGLDLSTVAASYEALVGTPAENGVAFENGWTRVAPGEPERSFLIRKLELPGVGEGGRMPPGDSRVTDYYRGLVEVWIAQGANP